MGAVHSPKASVGVDGAPFLGWLRSIADHLLNLSRHISIDFSRKDGPVEQSERFEALKAYAASGHAGCKASRERLKLATNRGLAAALGRELPPILNTEASQ